MAGIASGSGAETTTSVADSTFNVGGANADFNFLSAVGNFPAFTDTARVESPNGGAQECPMDILP